MSIPRHDFINSEPSSSSQIPNLSQAQLYAGLAKLEYLTYRIGHLSSFVSAADEAVAFSTEFSSNLIYFSGEVYLFCAISLTYTQYSFLLIACDADRGKREFCKPLISFFSDLCGIKKKRQPERHLRRPKLYLIFGRHVQTG